MVFRKRKALSLEDKMHILKYYDENFCTRKKKQMATELKVPIATFFTILKNRKEIEEHSRIGGSKRKKMRAGKFAKLENILAEWVHQANTLKLPISGPILTEKAHEIAQNLDITEFTGSNGWRNRFKARYGIVYRQSEAVNEEVTETYNNTILVKRSEQQGLANSDSVQNLDSAKKEQPELLETAITIKEEPLNSFHFETTLAEDFSIEDCSRVKEEPDFIDIKEEIGVSASFESGTEDTLDAFNANGVEKPSKINDDPVSRDLDLVDLMFLDFARRFKLFSARTQITVNSRICHMLAEVEMNEMEARQQHAA